MFYVKFLQIILLRKIGISKIEIASKVDTFEQTEMQCHSPSHRNPCLFNIFIPIFLIYTFLILIAHPILAQRILQLLLLLIALEISVCNQILNKFTYTLKLYLLNLRDFVLGLGLPNYLRLCLTYYYLSECINFCWVLIRLAYFNFWTKLNYILSL